jgi:hypothetical protein
MDKTFLSCSILFIGLISTAGISNAGQVYQGLIECQPTYGYFIHSDKWGWYGARREVKTPLEAKEILDHIFVRNTNIKTITIRERAHFFVAEIKNKNDAMIDLILIDKRTGRVRSMF